MPAQRQYRLVLRDGTHVGDLAGDARDWRSGDTVDFGADRQFQVLASLSRAALGEADLGTYAGLLLVARA